MRLPFEGPWRLIGREWMAHLDNKPATYRIRAWNPLSDEAVEIARAGGVSDTEGILDIGTTGSGRGRLSTAFRAMSRGTGSHAAGRKFHAYGFSSVFPLEHICIDFVRLDTPQHAEAVELWLLEDYLQRFKDLPPLNSTAGNWRKVEKWLRNFDGRAPRAGGCVDLRGIIPGATEER